ncbi:MAG TPA: FHA domain-containing protein [Bryobacteraceae bacterium]|nr:hypothetical protein [Acidobacteriaceae bacterium]
MSEQPNDVLRVSLEDLETVQAAPPVVASTETAAGVKSYGSIHEPAEPEALTKEDENFFLKAWVYLGIAGLVGAVAGWAIAEPGFVDGAGYRWGNIWLIPIILTLMCVGFGAAESIVERSLRKAAIRIGIALPLGVVMSFISDRIANMIYAIGLGFSAIAGVQTHHNPVIWIVRAIAWAALGAAGGVIYGIIDRSGKKIGYGALGGAIGAAIGGLIFDPISFATKGGAPSRVVGFALLGLATGVAMGLVESALKDRWLYVTSGPLAGKQFILYKPQTVIGSTQSCDIYLFKDPEILPRHAVLMQKGSHIHLAAEGTVYVSGQPVRGTRVLESGAIVQLGRYKFRYQERARE